MDLCPSHLALFYQTQHKAWPLLLSMMLEHYLSWLELTRFRLSCPFLFGSFTSATPIESFVRLLYSLKQLVWCICSGPLMERGSGKYPTYFCCKHTNRSASHLYRSRLLGQLVRTQEAQTPWFSAYHTECAKYTDIPPSASKYWPYASYSPAI